MASGTPADHREAEGRERVVSSGRPVFPRRSREGARGPEDAEGAAGPAVKCLEGLSPCAAGGRAAPAGGR